MATSKLFQSVLCLLALLALGAAPAQAQVQYNANLGFGFGDFSPGDFANNAIPACAAIGVTSMGGATTGSVNFVGLASILPGTPPGVRFLAQSGANGLQTTCTSVQTNFGAVFTRRTQMTTFVWPVAAGTVSAGGGFGGPTATPFVFAPPWAPLSQQVRATAPVAKNKFGGSAAMAGIGNTILGIRTGAATVFVGTLPVPLGVGGAGGPATPTGIGTGTNTFWLQSQAPQPAGCVPFGTCTVPGVTPGFQGQPYTASWPRIPVLAQGAFFPWTTGTVMVADNLGNFTTTRTRTGADTRNSAGTTGVLQLVSPAVVLIGGLVPIGFAPTAELTVTFAPEPVETTLLASGALVLWGLHVLRRRRR